MTTLIYMSSWSLPRTPWTNLVDVVYSIFQYLPLIIDERHIHNLTAPLRQKFVKAFLEQLSRLAKTINIALSEASKLPIADRELFREMFHTKVDVCLREVRAAVPSLIS